MMEVDHESEPTQLEEAYNELYSSLEQIGRLVGDAATSRCELLQLYSTCNAAIEQLVLEETVPAFIDSLQQLQESLVVQRRLVSEDVASSSTESADDYSQPGSGSLRDDENESRALAILAAKRTPSCAGLEEIAGLEEAKQMLQEALVLPAKYPHLFTGCRQPWSRVLLYGPPGTGKTRLAHAVAAEINADFYCVSTADLLSSWVGESEKMIRELFSVDGEPGSKQIIFIDEVDSLCRKRSSSEAEHARRLKTELLIQIEDASKRGIFLLCATNCPWELDSAFLRRFQRRIYVSTPDREARRQILELHSGLAGLEWQPLLDLTEGYSGSDLATLAQYALLQPIRELESAEHWAYNSDGLLAPCASDHPSMMTSPLKELPPAMVGARDVEIGDFVAALSRTPRTIAKSDLEPFESFTKQYGQPG